MCVCKYSLIFDFNYLPKMIILQVSTLLKLDFTMLFQSIPQHVLIKMCTDVGERNVECLHAF